MSQNRNADELLYQIEAQKLGHEVKPLPETEEVEEEKKEDPIEEAKPLDSEPEEKPEEKEEEPEEKPEEKASAKVEKDEYGSELPPPRTYTEEEVQRMIRDRLARGRHNDATPQSQAVQQAAQNFTPDPESSENWEVQLEKFVENTIQKVSHKQQTEQQYARERQVQADFESKFTTGMSRYKDFNEVIGNKPVTDAMMLATRGMKDPAAFLYAAAKNHGKELERIAQIQDPYQQGAEIGKLEANMRKARNTTNAPRPLTKTQGDMGGKGEVKLSIDDKIRQHAKTRLSR